MKVAQYQKNNSQNSLGVQGTSGQFLSKKKSVKYSPGTIIEENSGQGTKRSDESVPILGPSIDDLTKTNQKTD
jgi:hypothetical protein